MHTCTHAGVCPHTPARMQMCTHARTHACTLARMHACMHARTHARRHAHSQARSHMKMRTRARASQSAPRHDEHLGCVRSYHHVPDVSTPDVSPLLFACCIAHCASRQSLHNVRPHLPAMRHMPCKMPAERHALCATRYHPQCTLSRHPRFKHCKLWTTRR